MAWRLRSSVVRGEIDNRVKGRITGKLWLFGREEPIVLKLEGNGSRDVAGSLFVFENPDPQLADEHIDLFPEQVGSIGDYTASRKVRAFDIPIDEALAMIRRGEKPPEHWANSLYLEWFSSRNGRVVIESHDYETKIVDTVWSLDEQSEVEQLERNAESMDGFMRQLGEVIEQQSDESIWYPDDDRTMDEFDWERFMKEADARAEKYGRLLEKYIDHTDRDQIVAREMGWDKLADDLGDYDEAVQKGELDPFNSFDEDFDGPQPNPQTEGVDWVWNEFGHPVHPLQHHATEIVMTLWHECEVAGLLAEGEGNEELHEMLFNGQCVGAKLAGALNGLAYDRIVDGGFVVACLKRALPYFDKMMSGVEQVKKQGMIDNERLQRFSVDMFAIRAEIVQLMERFRNEM
jgi:hypothetical protein